MGIPLGAVLSGAAGFVTGLLMSRVGSGRETRARTWLGIAGAVLGVVAYGLFLLLGAAISIFTFGSAVDPLPAVICVLFGCVCVLLMALLRSFFARRFGLPAVPEGERRDVTDIVEARPSGGRGTMWFGGVLLAILPAYYGLQCLLTRKGTFGTTLWRDEVQGGAAIALGLGWIGVGAFLHFHFFHGLHPAWHRHSRSGKIVSLVVACTGLAVAGIWSMAANAP
jgi:hypothetical protein